MHLKSAVLTRIGEDTVAVPEGEDNSPARIIRLNRTAADIWEGLEKGETPETIAAALVEKYDGVELPHALESVNAVVEKLRDAGMLTE